MHDVLLDRTIPGHWYCEGTAVLYDWIVNAGNSDPRADNDGAIIVHDRINKVMTTRAIPPKTALLKTISLFLKPFFWRTIKYFAIQLRAKCGAVAVF